MTTTATLRTSSGELVVTVRVPTFNPPPRVIVWGSRVFAQSEPEESRNYYEVFAYTVPERDPKVE